jgi:hypothetical protein
MSDLFDSHWKPDAFSYEKNGGRGHLEIVRIGYQNAQGTNESDGGIKKIKDG